MLNNSNEEKVIVVPLSILEKNDPNAIEQNKVLLSALQDSNKKITSIKIEGGMLQISYTNGDTTCKGEIKPRQYVSYSNMCPFGYSLSFKPKFPSDVDVESVTKGSYSIAMGKSCYSNGFSSIALGSNCNANDDYSTAIGYGCQTSQKGEFACGK